MRLLGRLVVFAASVEVGCWVLATALRPGSWRYNISDLYAAGAPRPLLVMAGEVVFAVGLGALVLGLRRSLPATDHRTVACVLLIVASLGALAGGLARNGCEESRPRCQGDTFTTVADWVHGVGGLMEILGIVGAAFVAAAVLPRPWSTYSAATGGVGLVLVLGRTRPREVPLPIVEKCRSQLVIGITCPADKTLPHMPSGPAALCRVR